MAKCSGESPNIKLAIRFLKDRYKTTPVSGFGPLALKAVAFNANPLMRFDGYYILTELFEVPNLAPTAQSWLRGWARWFFLGLPRDIASPLDGRAAFTYTYAILAFVWRILICVGLIVAAASMWQGAGVVLAAFAIVTWFGVPLVRFAKLLRTRSASVDAMRRRLATSLLAFGLISTVALMCLPWPGAQQTTGVVDYKPLTVVRTGVDGFVSEMLVRSGDTVKRGQALARLRNDTLMRDFAIQNTKVEASQLRIRGLLGQRKLAALAAERKQLVAFESQLVELTKQVEGLTLRAPTAGRVVTRSLDARVGILLTQGDTLLEIGNDDNKTIDFSIPQQEISAFRNDDNVHVSVTVPTGIAAMAKRIEGHIERVEPRATVQPLDPSLCTLYGGPLPVRHVPADDRGTNQGPQFELLEPHFTASFALDAEQSRQLKAGQRVSVVLGTPRESLGAHLWKLLTDYLLKPHRNQES